MQHEIVGSVRIGPGGVSIKRKGSSGVDTAQILGQVGDGESAVIYLDRVVHRHDGEQYREGWRARGALVTELYRGE